MSVVVVVVVLLTTAVVASVVVVVVVATSGCTIRRGRLRDQDLGPALSRCGGEMES